MATFFEHPAFEHLHICNLVKSNHKHLKVKALYTTQRPNQPSMQLMYTSTATFFDSPACEHLDLQFG